MIDDIDNRLILELQEDGRRSNVELSRKLKISEGAVRRRLSILRKKGIVKVVAEINARKLGFTQIGMIGLHVRTDLIRLAAEELAKSPHVCFLAITAGGYDIIAIVITESNEGLLTCIEKEISNINGVFRAETWVSLEIIKGDSPSINTSQLLESLQLSHD